MANMVGEDGVVGHQEQEALVPLPTLVLQGMVIVLNVHYLSPYALVNLTILSLSSVFTSSVGSYHA